MEVEVLGNVSDSNLVANEEEAREENEREQKQSFSQTTNDQPTQDQFNEEVNKQKLTRLHFLLEKTSLYSDFLSKKLVESTAALQKDEVATVENGNSKKTKSNGKSNGKRKRGKKGKESAEADLVEEQPIKKGKAEISSTDIKTSPSKTTSPPTMKQPDLVTGGMLREYQLKGVEWLISLYENGLNGILADEMGLGKTIQCISLLAHLVQHDVKGPFLIVGPLSTLSNWVKEVTKWCPTIPVLMYHGSKDERTALRSKLNPKQWKDTDKIQMLPIIVTSYEIVMNDRKYLAKLKWKYIIVDEGHRIKNLNCRLIRELKSYQSANRLLLTGTPLQNNLAELWSLLNFLLPDIFDDLESFQSWFDFSALQEADGSKKIMEQEQKSQVVTKLHHILRPFLLRRIKEDVELDMPKKQEKVIYTKLTSLQQTYYKAILNRELHSVLSEEAVKRLKKTSSLQNMLMQLRKACNHPYLFEWPLDEEGNDLIDESIVEESGKMQILDRILKRLKADNHKVLIFSQMTKVLDILEDYMELRQYEYVRLDGSTAQTDRQQSIEDFTKGSDVFCFLLSTRAGGLGINLTAADTVVFYDNDWNPQADLQAQDRCHRIGQQRPVRIYRFATANSVESKILERANNKLKLDRLVIQKGNFVGVKSQSALTEMSELEEILKSESPNAAGNVEDVTDEVLFTWDFD